MREGFIIIYIALLCALVSCAVASKRTRRQLGTAVFRAECAFFLTVLGNFIIIVTSSHKVAMAGYYIFFIGMDIVVDALLYFAFEYCDVTWKNKVMKWAVYSLFIIDCIQYALNPIFHHAFKTEETDVGGRIYHRLVPGIGQAYHRLICYGIFAVVLGIFVVKMLRVSRVLAEKYFVVFFSMLVAALWQTVYIISSMPIDTSMVGFALCGILMFYFALYYRPVGLRNKILANLSDNLTEGLIFFDSDRKCIYANKKCQEIMNITEKTYINAAMVLHDMFGDLSDIDVDIPFRRVVGFGSGNEKYYVIIKHYITNSKGKKEAASFRIKENTDEQRAIANRIYNATHDTMTGLFTREYLYDRIHDRLRASHRLAYLVVYIYIHDFKILNDTYGINFGDLVIREIAKWMTDAFGGRGVYGRLTGDSFGLFISKDEFKETVIEKSLNEFTVNDGKVDLHVLLQLGVYEVDEYDKDVSEMFDRAHMSLSAIRGQYEKHVAWYDEKLREKILVEQKLNSQLTNAIAEGQVRPYFQPLVDKDGGVIGAEVLVRWIHPELGFLSPGIFIPLFEKNGRIAEVDKYMWRSACEVLARWKKEGKELLLSVNISPKDFYFLDVVSEIKGLIEEYELDPSMLRVEITETVMMNDEENRMKTLVDFKDAGFIVEMDDFGSGYSSLNLLKDMPVDLLKIDMVFLRQSVHDVKARKIVKNIIRMTEDLEMISLVEGVETEAQFEALREMGCNLYQGYYFSKPVPIAEFEEYAAKHPRKK